MPVVQYKQTAHACQVDGIPALVVTGEKTKDGDAIFRPLDRSVAGALHLRPGGTLVLTADEFEWLKKSKKSVFKDLLVLAEDPPVEKKVEAKAPEAAKKADKVDPPAA
jgi:hypothetical protein